jgi:RNA polymerase sigma factor for flagellar operon FliA
MNPAELFQENLALIDRIVGRLCRHGSLFGADAEDFASAARLHLLENDYAALRRFEGRSSLVTYLTIVLRRLFLQERNAGWGRWSESAAARKLGEVAVRAEQLIRRDGRTIEEALPILRRLDGQLTRERLEALVEQFPERRPRPRLVEAADVEDELLAPTSPEERVSEREVRGLSDRAGAAIRDAMAALPLEDRTLVRLHFRTSMTIAEIARALGIPQRPLYRRLERVLARLGDALRAAGLDRRNVDELIGSKLVDLDFGIFSVENGAEAVSIPTGAERT